MLAKLFRKNDSPGKPAAIYLGLREQLFHLKADDLNLKQPPAVLGVLMETGYPQGIVTLVALADGTASLYFSSGGGVLGGGEHPAVAQAARDLTSAAAAQLNELSLASAYPLPGPGRVRFYVLTAAHGVQTGEAAEEDLGRGLGPLAGLFAGGHAVITQLRLTGQTGRRA